MGCFGMSGKIHIGIGGWTFEPWRGVFYPEGLHAEARAGIRQPQAHLDRDQRHLLFDLQAGELGQVARRDARRLRLRGEGLALLHQPPRAGRGRRVGRAVHRPGPGRARRSAGADQLAVHGHQEVRSRGFRGVPEAAAAGGWTGCRCATRWRCATTASRTSASTIWRASTTWRSSTPTTATSPRSTSRPPTSPMPA